MKFEFKNQLALITGGSTGLGFVIAQNFIRNGADICICSRNNDELREAAQKLANEKIYKEQKIGFKTTDVANIHEMDNLFVYTQDNFGIPDILVTCAGIYGPIGSIENNSWEQWEYAVRVNIIGTVYCTRKIISLWKKFNRGGKIICLSGGGATKGLPYFSSYAATKSAVVRTVETLAMENKNSKIDINAIAPGALNTRMLDQALDAGQEVVGADMFKKFLAQKENGGASLENAAELVAYLASNLSDGISGKLISAVWDDWKNFHLNKEKLMNTDLYTLRRITEEN